MMVMMMGMTARPAARNCKWNDDDDDDDDDDDGDTFDVFFDMSLCSPPSHCFRFV